MDRLVKLLRVLETRGIFLRSVDISIRNPRYLGSLETFEGGMVNKTRDDASRRLFASWHMRFT